MNKKWTIKEVDKARADELQTKFNIKSLAAKIIAEKGLSDDEVQRFLNPTRKNFYDPFLMPDMDKAIDRIIQAIDNNEKIVIYGDYDADGITSTTILKRFMRDRGIEVRNIYS